MNSENSLYECVYMYEHREYHTTDQKDCNTFYSMNFGMQLAHRAISFYL